MMSGHKKFRGAITAAALAGFTLAAGTRPAHAARPATDDTNVSSYQSSNTARLIVGHSMVMNTQVALRRIYVGNPTVLLSYTASANQIVLTGKATGTSSLMVWDVNGNSKLYTIEVDIDPSSVQDALKVEYPTEPITATVTEDHISLSGNVSTKAVADGALALAQSYSKLVVSSLQVTGHPREVKLKVQIAEVDRTKLATFGINFLSMGKNLAAVGTQQFGSASFSSFTNPITQTTANVSNPLNFFIYNTEYNVGLSVADLASHNVLQILAEPTLTSMSGQSASFLSGGEFPFPTVQASAGSTPVVTVSFRPYGIKLDFTPTVNDDGTIRLKVAPEVSSLDYSNAVQISGYTIPAIATRRSQTEVELKNGQSFSISGLLDHQTTESFSRTPGIASVPILGQLFKSKNNSHSVTELVVIITAELVDPTAPEVPQLPKQAVPSLDRDSFDKQLSKSRASDPNVNRDTGKAAPAATPAAAAPATVNAAARPATPAPAAVTAPAATPATATQPAAPAPDASSPAATFTAPRGTPASLPVPSAPIEMAMQSPPAMTGGPAAPPPATTPPAAQAAPPMRLRLRTASN